MSERKKKPMNFGRVMLASALGTLIVFAVGWLLVSILSVAMVAKLSASDTKSGVTVKEGSFLTIDLGALPERTPDKLQQYMSNGKTIGFTDLMRCIATAATDDKIEGIYLKTTAAGGPSWGQAEELRDALVEFRESGKPIVAYGDSYSASGYYVASAANSVNVHPSGMVDFRGIGGEVMFYKDLLDKLDVHMQLIRPVSCAYKSAGEVYTMNHMSDANREQIRVYISSIWKHVCGEISNSRTISVDSLNAIADNLTGYLAYDAVACGLVDTVRFESDVRNYMKDEFDGENLITVSSYAKTLIDMGKQDIAIIYAEGNVVDGTQQGFETNVYGDDVVKALNRAAKDDKVKAVVLRVNSPGGSVLASEAITNAVRRCKDVKPLVVSMSDVAASAGYEISCFADRIVAEPTTITGSIGVFATLPDVGDMMRKKLGLTTDTVQTNRNSNGLTVMRPLSPAARAMMQRNVEDFYVTFVSRVTEGRNLSYEHVDSIAKGRVWTGEDALKLGLVDELGNLSKAVAIAADLAKVEDYKAVDYPGEEDVFTRLMKLSGDDSEENVPLGLFSKMRVAWQIRQMRNNMPEPLDALNRDLNWFAGAQGLQARIEFIFL